MHRSQGQEEGGAATEVKTFDQLTDEEFDKAVKDDLKVEENPIEKPAGEEKPAKDVIISDEEKEEEEIVDDGKGKGEERLAGEEKLVDEENEEDDLPAFTLTKLDDKGNEVESETSWNDLAEASGFKIEVKEGEEATFETFKASQDKYIAEKIAVVESKSFDKFLDEKFPTPEAQMVIKALAADPKMTIQDILNPLKDFDEVLAKSDEALLRDKMENIEKLSNDEIDEEIERLVSEGRLGLEAKKIRNIVSGNREAAAQNHLSTKAAAYDAALNRRIELEKKEVETLLKIADDTGKFAGGKVTDDIKKDIKTKIASGHYKKLFASDPQAAYQAILQMELGAQVEKRLLGKGKSEGIKSVTSTLLNKTIPTRPGASASRSGPKEPGEEIDSFDAWDAINTQKVGVTRGKD